MSKCPPHLEKFKFQKGQRAWNFDSIEKKCQICSKTFLVSPSHFNRKSCCSRICAGKLKTKKFIDAVKDRQSKICFGCKRELPLSEFHKHNQKPDGLNPRCKKCHHESNMKWISEHREYYRKRTRDYMRKHRIGGTTKDFRNVKNKRDYPQNESCEMCKQKVRLVYHHWDNTDFAKGMWICTKCHVAAHWLETYDPKIFYDLKNHRSQ